MIVVTGGSRGLGAAMGQYFALKGHDVLLLSRSGSMPEGCTPQALASLASEQMPSHSHADTEDGRKAVAHGDRVLAVPSGTVTAAACDVRDFDSLKGAAKTLRQQGHTLTALINAAGVASMNLTLTMPARTVQDILDINLAGTIFSCQAFSPLMVRAKKGVIVNFSTIAVPLAIKGEAVYAASKAGVETFSRAFAREMSPYGVRVHVIAPGPVETDLIKGVPSASIKAITDQQLDTRQATPSDICQTVDMLMDERAAALTGDVLHIRGA